MASKVRFLEQIERLKSNFGDHHYQAECVGFIWQESKHLSDGDLSSIVDDFIADLSFAPKRKSFREAISNKRLSRYQVEKEERSQEVRRSLPAEEVNRRLRHISLIFGGMNTASNS
jgi:hypothetical protein